MLQAKINRKKNVATMWRATLYILVALFVIFWAVLLGRIIEILATSGGIMPFKTGEVKATQGINATFAILMGLSFSMTYALWFWFTKMKDLLD